jgi:TRAP-type C4-dicarboxylate transport system permease small subunit
MEVSMVDRWMDRYCKALSYVMVACLAVMVVMVFGNVVLRYGFNSGITVSEELSRWLFLWVVFLGATIAVRERAHMGTDMLIAKLPPPARRAVLVLAHLLMLWVTWLLLRGSWTQTQLSLGDIAPVSGLSTAWATVCGVVFAVSSGVMLLLDLWALLTGKPMPGAEHLPSGLEAPELELQQHLQRKD